MLAWAVVLLFVIVMAQAALLAHAFMRVHDAEEALAAHELLLCHLSSDPQAQG